jgi:hypothetical protein
MTDSTFSEKTAAAQRLFGAAAKLAQKQAELAKLNNVTLPRLYHAIGKHLVGLETLPAELEHHRKRIRQIEAGIAATPEEIKSDPACGFAAKAKQFAQQAAQKAAKATGDAAAAVQIQAAYVAMGKDALEKFGSEVAPKELQAELLAAFERREQLNREIESNEKTLSTKNMPSLLVLLAGLLFGLAWVLPFAQRASDVEWGGSIALSVLREGWLAILLCVGANTIALSSLWLLLARPAHSRLASTVLTLGCGIVTLLNMIWCITFWGHFLIGFFAWLACFGILFVELRRSEAAAPRSGSASLAIAGLVAVCVLLGPIARSVGRSLVSSRTAAATASSSETAAATPPAAPVTKEAPAKPSQVEAIAFYNMIFGMAAQQAAMQRQQQNGQSPQAGNSQLQRLCPNCQGSGYEPRMTSGVNCFQCGGHGVVRVGLEGWKFDPK